MSHLDIKDSWHVLQFADGSRARQAEQATLSTPTSPSSNGDQIKQIQDLRDIAAEEEKDIETRILLIKTTLQPISNRAPAYQPKPPYRTRGPTARTFMAHAGGYSQYERNSAYDMGAAYATALAYTARPVQGNQGTGERIDEDALMEQFHLLQHYMDEGQKPSTSAFLSPAESALRNARGTDRPIECWGCTGHATLHSQRFHIFRDCPHKYDADIRRTAFQRMMQMREEYEANRAREAREQALGTHK